MNWLSSYLIIPSYDTWVFAPSREHWSTRTPEIKKSHEAVQDCKPLPCPKLRSPASGGPTDLPGPLMLFHLDSFEDRDTNMDTVARNWHCSLKTLNHLFRVYPIFWRSFFLWMFQLANPSCGNREGSWGFFSSAGWQSDAHSNKASKDAPKDGPTVQLPSFLHMSQAMCKPFRLFS